MLQTLQQQMGDGSLLFLTRLTDWGGPIGWLFALQIASYLAGLRTGLLLSFGAVLSLLANTWLKWLFVAPRPYFLDPSLTVHRPTGGFGMPSGHAQGAAAVWLGIAAVVSGRRWLWALLVLLAFAVALSRWLLGVHSFAQVLIGFAIGAGSLAALLWARPWLSRQRARLSLPALLILAGVLVAGSGAVTYLILELRADFVFPPQWQANAVARGAAAADLLPARLLSPASVYALVAGLLGLLLVTGLDRVRPVAVSTSAGRLLAVVCGVVITAGFWSLGGAIGSTTPLALAMPLFYPLVCLYLPIWLASRWSARKEVPAC